SRTPTATAGVDLSSIPISRSTPLAPPHAARTLSPRLIDLRQRRRAPPSISAARTTSPRLTELLRRYSASINLQSNKGHQFPPC
ncbi:Os03g0556200, partial [Oryza sativa Japonica Group]